MRAFFLLTVLSTACSGAVKPEDTSIPDNNDQLSETSVSSDTSEPSDTNDAPVESDLVINEVLADSDTTSDWLELYNGSDEDMDLSGYGLSDDPNDPLSILPENTIVPAGGYLLIWADDGAGAEPEPHVQFKLSKDGETVSLYDGTGVLLDQVEFPMIDEDGDGSADPDKSYGRSPDGSDTWLIFSPPTPQTSNG